MISILACNLEWKPPEDDGGCPILYYIVEKCDEDLDGKWSIDGQTDGPATTYFVENIIENHRYKFRVSCVTEFGQSEPMISFSFPKE